jgi:hypothetical protein
MEDTIRQRVVGQDHVVSAISDAVRISRAGLQAPNRPVASFLFLGPTGVGKVSLLLNWLLSSADLSSLRFRQNFLKHSLDSCSMTNKERCKLELRLDIQSMLIAF